MRKFLINLILFFIALYLFFIVYGIFRWFLFALLNS